MHRVQFDVGIFNGIGRFFSSHCDEMYCKQFMSSNYDQFHFAFQKKSSHNSNPIELIFPLLLVFWSFSILFLVCECGEKVSDQYRMYNDTLYRYTKWYLLSNEMRRLLVVVMSNTQQMVTICGFANTRCTRDTFKRVSWTYININRSNENCVCNRLFDSCSQTIKKSFSYFTILYRAGWMNESSKQNCIKW